MDNLLKGVVDPHLRTAKENVLGGAGKHDDFNVTQQYLKTVCSNLAEAAKSERLVLASECNHREEDITEGSGGGCRGGCGVGGFTGRGRGGRSGSGGRGTRVSLDSSTS